MSEAEQLIGIRRGAVVAPAGHGKTQVIAQTVALGQRTLVLTHTHAGVHAIRERIKRLGVPSGAAFVDTIAGWATRYAAAFPTIGQPPAGPPITNAEWQQVYRGGAAVLRIPAVRRVVISSYDRVLIDEYQDCNDLQHQLAIELSSILPTIVFGDPMQGIFEFAEARLNWASEVFPHFPRLFELPDPHRWKDTDPDLGTWIFRIRGQLERGEVIDLASGPAAFSTATGVYDMGFLFDGIEGRPGPTAAILCRRGDCNNIARNTRGAYQAIEEIAANRLRRLASEWDASSDPTRKCQSLSSFYDECAVHTDLEPGAIAPPEDLVIDAERDRCWNELLRTGAAAKVTEFLSLSRKHSRFRAFRRELWRDAERAFSDLDSGRSACLLDAAVAARQRLSATGRPPQRRVISTPLLLKGLEFDHVLVPNAAHFLQEQQAVAKLFYVAVSRATRTLSISSPSRYLQFPAPTL